MSHSSESSDQRKARLAEIRRQIAEGTYETPEKISAAVDKMLELFDSSADAPQRHREQ